MNFQKLLEELDKISLPKDEYVLVGSAPLAIRKIREANDLDVVVSDKLWRGLSQKHPIIEEFSVKKIRLSFLGIDVLGQGSKFQNPTIVSIDEMIKTADIISGHRFLNLDLLKKFKAQIGREKDLKDIELIDQYFNSIYHPPGVA